MSRVLLYSYVNTTFYWPTIYIVQELGFSQFLLRDNVHAQTQCNYIYTHIHKRKRKLYLHAKANEINKFNTLRQSSNVLKLDVVPVSTRWFQSSSCQRRTYKRCNCTLAHRHDSAFSAKYPAKNDTKYEVPKPLQRIDA
jgi:hypothetical protein